MAADEGGRECHLFPGHGPDLLPGKLSKLQMHSAADKLLQQHASQLQISTHPTSMQSAGWLAIQ